MGRLGAMQCSLRTLGHLALFFGLVASGALSLAIATDFWLFTEELIPIPTGGDGGDGAEGPALDEGGGEEGEDSTTAGVEEESESSQEAGEEQGAVMEGEGGAPMYKMKMHAGLWRICVIHDTKGSDEETLPVQCTNIAYFGQDSERKDAADTTNSILRAIRKSSPVIVGSLLMMVTALSFSILGSARRDVKTLVAAILYICSALCLAVGVIFYISAVNDEVSHRKKSLSNEPTGFEYRYGWAFFFAGSSFISAMVASVNNISMYLRRFPSSAAAARDTSADVGRLVQPPSVLVVSVVKQHQQQLQQQQLQQQLQQQQFQQQSHWDQQQQQPGELSASRPVSRINITTPV